MRIKSCPRQKIAVGGIQYPFTYEYKLNDGLSKITYPSSRAVTYDYDDGGRIKSVTGLNNSVTTDYTKAGTSISYAPHGAISSLTFKNNIAETRDYNSRLQPLYIQASGLLALAFDYGTTLTRASESGSGAWFQDYGYDDFGNRWVPTASNTGLPSPSNEVPNGSNWYLTNNRINGWGYDPVGNITAIQNMPRTYGYDAENRQTTATVNGVTTTYAYDGEGRRVSKTWNGQTTTTLVYDAFGHMAAEYGGSPVTSGTQYFTTDTLGSTRLVTDSSGVAAKCDDYLPFGEEIGNGTAGRTASCFGTGSYPVAGGASNTEFTSKERDAETGLDYFGARYMSSAQGRFTSADPLMASAVLQNPQSWNRYAYTLNNPLRYIDPTGELWVDSQDANNPYQWVDECQKKQTCYQSVAAAVGNQLRVYGSNNASDVTNYDPNKAGYVDLRKLGDHPDANFELKEGAKGFLSLKNAAGFFNTAEQYGEQYPNDALLFVTDAGRADGALFARHKTHGLGRSVDIRYIDANGKLLQGDTAAENADLTRTRTLVDAAKRNGFNQIYSDRPGDFGTQYASGHDTHLHLGTTPPVVKIKPPSK